MRTEVKQRIRAILTVLSAVAARRLIVTAIVAGASLIGASVLDPNAVDSVVAVILAVSQAGLQ